VANGAQWPAPLAVDMGYIAVSHHMEGSVGLAMPVVAQWLADEVFWQGPVGPPGKAATCSHHLEKAVPGTRVLDVLEEGFDMESDCLETAVRKRLVLEELDVAVRMVSADDPL
jgi:hypothetical protein